jgi:hypothetical protein
LIAFIFTILICASFYVSGQKEIRLSEDDFRFNSYFQKLAKGNFEGYANGLLQLEYDNGKTFSVAFSKDTVQLDVKPDLNEIYDVSSKNYLVKNKDIRIEYTTYHWSNAITIILGSKKYKLSSIDGTCEGIINGLDYQYIPIGDKELLIINFSDKVGLRSTKGYTLPDLFIKEGSTLLLYVKK